MRDIPWPQRRRCWRRSFFLQAWSERYLVQPVFLGKYSPDCIGTCQSTEMVHSPCSLQSTTTAPFTAPIPWRRPGVRHNNNEIYFDIEESLDAIVDRYVVMSRPTYSWAACRRGNTLTSSVWGRINCNSRLSGNPDLLLNFSDPKRMHQCSFHPCIRYVNVCICGLTFFSS